MAEHVDPPGKGGRRGTALARAIALLSRREHSGQELRRKLIERGFGDAEVDAALLRLQESGLQDDLRFADSLARFRANSGRGPLQLQAELARHGLANGVSQHAIEHAEAEQDWASRAMALAERRLRGSDADDPRARKRLADFLLRRGFPWPIVSDVLARISQLGDPGCDEA